MDTTKAITHVSLCAGYGGIDLGLKRAIPALRTIAFSEIESFACANLVSKMEAGLLDPAPIWTDLKTFPWSEFHGRVDILSGGYPCQPFSAAGKRLGAEDPRHLWPFIAAGIAAMRPGACFFENVEGHISLGLPDVLQDLAGMGYRTTWGVASASECGAPHQRKRVFILAYDGNNAGAHFWSRLIDSRRSCAPEDVSSQAANQQAWRNSNAQRWQDAPSDFGIGGSWSAEPADSQCAGLERFRANPGQSTEPQFGNCGGEGCCELADSQYKHDGGLFRAGQLQQQQEGGSCGQRVAATSHQAWPSRPGEQQFAWEPPRVVVGNASSARHARTAWSGGECAQGQPIGYVAESDGAMGYTNSPRPQERTRQQRAGIQGADADGGESAGGEIKPELGLLLDGSADGLGGPNVSGLSDQELAEIRQWMVASTNRTDSLRLLGNGVVPATAERAFRVLVSELMEHQP